MIRATNDVMRFLLFQASLPVCYWAESLYTATYILNLLPTNAILAPIPYFALSGTTPFYAHLRVFGCACYPNTSAIAPHKLGPRSCRCVFLGYSSDHKGYRCLDLTTNCLLISRHVVFDESSFPFASSDPPPDDLDSLFSSSPVVYPIAPPYPSSVVGTSETVAMPCAAHRPSSCHAWPRRPRPSHVRPWCSSSRHTRPRRPRLRHVRPRRSHHARPRRPTLRHMWLRCPSWLHTWPRPPRPLLA
jgi:hypothetical protein